MDAMDCGSTSLRMIAKYYGKYYSAQTLRERCFITREGVSMLGISDAAESIGFRTMGVRITFEQLAEEALLPCILHWNQNHFVVCYNVKKYKGGKYTIYIADPASQRLRYTKEEFLKCWISTRKDGKDQGAALLLEPGPDFREMPEEKEDTTRDLSYFVRYLTPYKKQFAQLILGMVVANGLQMVFPFLTQSLVDVGIQDSNLNFITLILITQLMLFTAQLVVGFIQSWISLHIHSRINISSSQVLDDISDMHVLCRSNLPHHPLL